MMLKKLPKNPYPGLRPFEFAENHLFFGREGQSEEVLRRLRESHFVAVVGTSGSGKSSLVRAGLLPLLYGGFMTEAGAGWRVALFRPGDNPIHNLTEALVKPAQFSSPNTVKNSDSAKKEEELKLAVTETVLRRSAVGLRDYANGIDFAEDENLLVVVDQFEELFRFKKENQSQIITEKSETQKNAENEAAAFVKLLLEAAGDKTRRIYVVITMRSDFLGDCSQFRDLPETINNGQYLIPRLTTEQLRKAIESPAKVKGARIQPALVARLLNDIGDDQDQLPVLQHALMRTWDEWARAGGDKQVEINFHHYNATGGMATALSRHADEAFFELGDGEDSDASSRKQIIAEKLFKCLTETDRENRETRRATALGKICQIADADIAEVISVINVFRQPGRTFLMPPFAETLDENTLIDISHESLIRKWDRLKKWVEEEAKAAQTYRRLAEDALLHKEGYKGFWGDPELTKTLDWKESFNPNETWSQLYKEKGERVFRASFDDSMKFLDDSKIDRNKKLAKEKRQRILLATLSALFFITTLVAGFMAFQARVSARQAESNAAEADRNFYKAEEERQRAEDQSQQAEKAKGDLEVSQVKLKTALDEQKEATETAEAKTKLSEEKTKLSEEKTKLAAEQSKRAKLSEAETLTALKEQKRSADEAEIAKNDAIQRKIAAEKAETLASNTAKREALNRDALIFLEQDENERALGSFTDLLTKYNTEEIKGEADRINGKWFTLHNLGIVSLKLRNFTKAEERYKEALAFLDESEKNTSQSTQSKDSSHYFQLISYRTDGEINRNRVTTLRRLAQLHREQARNNSDDQKSRDFNLLAIENYDKLLKILPEERTFEKQPTYPADVYVELADSLSDLYDTESYVRAKDLYEKAVTAYGQKRDFAKQVIVLKKWAKAATSQIEGDVVFDLLGRAARIQEDDMNLSPFNNEIADTYNEIANASQVFLYPENAAPYKKLVGLINTLNSKTDKSGSIISSDENEVEQAYTEIIQLADTYITIGKCRRAEKIYLYVVDRLDAQNEQSGIVSFLSIDLMFYRITAEFYQKRLKNVAEAEKYFAKILKAREQFVENSSLDTYGSKSYEAAGDFYLEKGDYVNAQKLYDYVFDVNSKFIRDSERDEVPIEDMTSEQAEVIVKIAHLYEAQNKLQEAESKHLEALELVKAEFEGLNGGNVRRTISTFHLYLGEFYERQNQPEKALQSYTQAYETMKTDSNASVNYGLVARIEIKLGTLAKTEKTKLAYFNAAFNKLLKYEASVKEEKQNEYHRYSKNRVPTVTYYTDLAELLEALIKLESREAIRETFKKMATRIREEEKDARSKEENQCQ